MRITEADKSLIREILERKIRAITTPEDPVIYDALDEGLKGVNGIWYPIWIKVEYPEIKAARGGGK